MPKAVYKSRISTLLELKSKMAGQELKADDLAEVIGVSRQTIYNWMSDGGVNSLPTAVHQAKLEQYFGVPFSKIWRLESVEDPELLPVPAR